MVHHKCYLKFFRVQPGGSSDTNQAMAHASRPAHSVLRANRRQRQDRSSNNLIFFFWFVRLLYLHYVDIRMYKKSLLLQVKAVHQLSVMWI